MATFTGTDAGETINPFYLSPTVSRSGGDYPSAAADTINAGGGNDNVEGGGGGDTVDLGFGEDSFTWRFGDGSDVISGGADFDILDFYGDIAQAGTETFALAAGSGGRSLSRRTAS